MTQVEPEISRERGPLFFTLLAFLVVVLVLAVWLFRPFLLIITVSGAVAIFLAPVNKRLIGMLGGRATLAATLLTLLAAVAILVPVLTSATVLSRQAVTMVERIRPQLQPAALQQVWNDQILQRYPSLKEYVDDETPARIIGQELSNLTRTMNRLVQSTVAGLTTAIVDFVIFLMVLFFLLRDGKRLGQELREISPLTAIQESQVVEHLAQTVRGMLLAMVVVPVSQGVIAYGGFLIFGVPVPLLWGVIVILAALVPVLGSPLGWVPAVLYLFATAATWQWVGMLLYGFFVISLSDNIIKPIVLHDAAKIHPLLGFFAIFGGLLSFGPLGFLVGPVILSLVLSGLRIYRLDVLRQMPATEAADSPASESLPQEVKSA